MQLLPALLCCCWHLTLQPLPLSYSMASCPQGLVFMSTYKAGVLYVGVQKVRHRRQPVHRPLKQAVPNWRVP